jgi:hypothetical protein
VTNFEKMNNTLHSAARQAPSVLELRSSAAHEGEKVEIALQAGAESTPRVPKGHVELLRGFAAQHKRLWRLT